MCRVRLMSICTDLTQGVRPIPVIIGQEIQWVSTRRSATSSTRTPRSPICTIRTIWTFVVSEAIRIEYVILQNLPAIHHKHPILRSALFLLLVPPFHSLLLRFFSLVGGTPELPVSTPRGTQVTRREGKRGTARLCSMKEITRSSPFVRNSAWMPSNELRDSCGAEPPHNLKLN